MFHHYPQFPLFLKNHLNLNYHQYLPYPSFLKNLSYHLNLRFH
jgi:hypothetical protein